MKPSTLNTLLVAKSIYGELKDLVNSGDKYTCTAGIILLQDFVELVVLAVLDELDADEQRALEAMPFDQLLGELKKKKVRVIKLGTIKALNKQRVISKHYGQLAEVASVLNYFNVAIKFVDTLLEDVIGAKLNEIFLTDILKDGAVKTEIKKSIDFSNNDKFLKALIGLRKAFYIAYEYDYCVYNFRSHDQSREGLTGLISFLPGGIKAPFWAKDMQWIEKNVFKPVDYVQINIDQLKTDCMEYGISTVDIENFRRLTPGVVKTNEDTWHYEYSTTLIANELNRENFNYCLDLLLDFLLKKQKFDSSIKFPKTINSMPPPPIYIGKSIYNKPSQTSNQIGVVKEKYYYNVDSIVSGFDASEKYLFVHLYPQESQSIIEGHIWGYLLVEES